MDDAAWLATRTFAWLADAPLSAPAPAAAVVADPTRVQAHVAAGHKVIAVAGYPTGRHHTLVKAAEARLAVQTGASEVWVCVDGALTDTNAILSDLIAIRDACPAPARLGVVLPSAVGTEPSGLGDQQLAQLAARAGYDSLIVAGTKKHQWPLEAVALVPGANTDAIIAQLDAGADYVAI